MRTKCPNCGNLLVAPAGPTNATVLLVGDFPGVEEVRIGTPFVGKVGNILHAEMQRVGMNMYACRVTNMWQHARSKECPVEWHVEQMVKEIKGRKFVLLMGSDLCKTLFHKGVMDLSGLEVKYELFPKVRFFVAPIPPYLGPVGEFRLAMKRFSEAANG